MGAAGDPRAAAAAAFEALRRGDADMVARFALARRLASQDASLLLGEAEAEFVSGRPDAGASLARVLAHNQGWAEGQTRLAAIRWERGEGEGALRGFVAALRAEPANALLWNGYIRALAACELFAKAADAAAAARAAGFADRALLIIEAESAGAAGDTARVERLLAELPEATPGRAAVAARQRLRTGDPAAAAALLDKVRGEAPWSVAAWALTDIAWRLLDDPRAEWLSGQPGLTSVRTPDLDPAMLARLGALLRPLHHARHQPPGQSVRGGTQTRGRLFERAEPEIAALYGALQAALDAHVADLPPADPTHPLLRRRDDPIRAEGGWSVRLAPGGHHGSHIHRAGLLSSACYISLPVLDAASQEGWLELGRPPDDLDLALGPRATVEPRVGQLVLFPSYLYHGTRPFPSGERLSVAFDAT